MFKRLENEQVYTKRGLCLFYGKVAIHYSYCCDNENLLIINFKIIQSDLKKITEILKFHNLFQILLCTYYKKLSESKEKQFLYSCRLHNFKQLPVIMFTL